MHSLSLHLRMLMTLVDGLTPGVESQDLTQPKGSPGQVGASVSRGIHLLETRSKYFVFRRATSPM